jgi:hypothetical protein
MLMAEELHWIRLPHLAFSIVFRTSLRETKQRKSSA